MAHTPRQTRPYSGRLRSLLSEAEPRKALRGGIQKSILIDFSGNVGDSRQMLTKTGRRLQERAWDTPTKGLLWATRPHPSASQVRKTQSLAAGGAGRQTRFEGTEEGCAKKRLGGGGEARDFRRSPTAYRRQYRSHNYPIFRSLPYDLLDGAHERVPLRF